MIWNRLSIDYGKIFDWESISDLRFGCNLTQIIKVCFNFQWYGIISAWPRAMANCEVQNLLSGDRARAQDTPPSVHRLSVLGHTSSKIQNLNEQPPRGSIVIFIVSSCPIPLWNLCCCFSNNNSPQIIPPGCTIRKCSSTVALHAQSH